MRALVIEDEERLRKVIVKMLREEGFATDSSADGEEGLYKAINWDYDVVLLDVMLPKLDGWEVLSQLRGQKDVPVLMLTARDSTKDRVKGLNAGADDYLPKPFDLEEMVARVRAVARRGDGQRNPELVHGDIVIKTPSREVYYCGEFVDIRGREYAMAELFVRRADEVLTRAFLYEHLFDENDESISNMLDVYVYKLRKKLGKDFITTLRGEGFIARSKAPK